MKRKVEKWQTKESVLIVDNRWVKVRRDVCLLPNGSLIDDYYYWEGGHFAQVFALTSEGLVVLVRQYRHGMKDINVELPAGLIDSCDLDPLKNAQQELLQETGFEAETWTALGVLHTSPAKSTTCSYSYLARSAKRVQEPHLDETEAIEVMLCPLSEVLSMIVQGELRDSTSVATCLLALQALGKI